MTRSLKSEQKSKMMMLYSIALSILMALFFDLLVVSNAVMPFRIIYVVAFMIIAFVAAYISIHLLRNKEIATNTSILVLRKICFLLAILINLKVIFSILWLDIPNIGFFSSNILIQGINGLLPLLEFSVVIIVNGIVLYVVVNRKNSIFTYEIATYVLCIIAIETFLAIYCFHVGSINGIRLGLSLFHILICGLVIWIYYKLRIREIHIKIAFSDVLLTFLSIGVFMMVYIPHGIYSLFGDNAVIIDSTLSIIYRGSLQPFYIADVYYSPIGGFVSTVFAYLCGLDNILLASTLPFLTAHLMLPYVTYHFLKEFVIEDSRVAIIGSVMALLMDGLAVILLPTYIGNLSRSVIEWQISPVTKSVYFSSIAWIWLSPFKTMGIASATAICNILPRRRIAGLLLGGVLFGFSFINPRQPFLAIFILAFLFGIRKIKLKEIIVIFSAALVLLGPILISTVFKTFQLLLFILHQMGLVAGEISTLTAAYYEVLADNALPITISVMMGSLITVFFLIRSTSKDALYIKRFAAEYMTKKSATKKLTISRKKRYIGLSTENAIFLALSFFILSYITLNAYQHPALSTIPKNMFVDSINYIIWRYHILIVLFIIGFFGFRHSSRILFTSAALALLVYSWITLTSVGKGITSPLIFVAMAIPSFSSFVKLRKKLILSVVFLFIFLGVFSSSLYSATVTTTESETRYADLPCLLHTLLSLDPGEELFPVSTYSYYSSRIINMAHLRLTSDPSCQLHIIDKTYTNNITIERVLKDNKNEILYNGNGFILYKSDRNTTLIAPNLGFEFGKDGPYNWTFKETDASHRACWDNSTNWSGNYSLSLSAEKGSGATWVRWESDKIFMTRNASLLYLEYYIKQDFDVGSSLVQLNFYNSTGGLIMFDRTWQTWNSDWASRTSLVNFPREFSYMTIFLVNRGEGKVWFDDVRLYIK